MQTFEAAAQALEQGQTTSAELVEACLGRIEDASGEGSRTFVKVYAEQARSSADAMDRLRKARRAPGRYAGIPISLKDLFDVAGEPTPAASLVLADAPPAASHAPLVQRLLSAGLILVGRTNMTEFAFSGVGINPHHGTPLAPYDRASKRIPGGSSSGAAVSVADGMALGAIGTDTGGSCRIPAAFCGVTGFKPTARRVPLAGVVPLSPTLDSVGPLAPTPACCAVLDAILAGEPERVLRTPAAQGLRLVLPQNVVLDSMDAPTERAFDRAVQRLDRAGVVLEQRHLASFDRIAQAHARGGFAVVEAFAWHREKLAKHGARYDQRIADRIRPGANMIAADYIALVEARTQIIAEFAREVSSYDAVLMPTVAIAPPPIQAFEEDREYWRLNNLILRNTALINFLDGCAISIPCHEAGAPPAGAMLARTQMGDHHLLAVAHALAGSLAG